MLPRLSVHKVILLILDGFSSRWISIREKLKSRLGSRVMAEIQLQKACFLNIETWHLRTPWGLEKLVVLRGVRF
jgi:hypothetical protein